MSDKLYVTELECYENVSVEAREHKLSCTSRCFDFDKLPETDIRDEMREFVLERGRKLSLLSIRSELQAFNQFCHFIRDEYLGLVSLKTVELEVMEKRIKVWLMKNGKALTQKKVRTDSGVLRVTDAVLIQYVRKIYDFLYPVERKFSYEEDRWYLGDISLQIKGNPIKKCDSISFQKILQDQIKAEVKQVIYIHLSQKALGTVQAEITAMNRFSAFLKNHFPDVESLCDIDRELFEDYLVYTNTEEIGRKSYEKDLYHLKAVFVTAGKVLQSKELEKMICYEDIGRTPEYLYKVYSDDEIKRINDALVNMDVQVARALLIHQMTGLRISDTLTLKQDAVYKTSTGIWMIRVTQVKPRKGYEIKKPISEDVKMLIKAACEYTNEKYGEREYVFVSDKNPDMPMQYGRIHYQLSAMIRKQDLRDDHGEPFTASTHIWRRCYGKKLAEMHVDDVTIAKLLGQATTGSLKFYRKIGNKMIADETRSVRSAMDNLLRENIKDWYEGGGEV